MDRHRTEKWLFLGDDTPRRGRRRAISAAAIGTTVLLAGVAALGGVLLALTQEGAPGIGWAWAAWTLAFAWTFSRLLYDVLRRPIRRL